MENLDIIIVADCGDTIPELRMMTLREQFGNDVLIVTPKEAKEKCIDLSKAKLANSFNFKIQATPPMIDTIFLKEGKSGLSKQEQRYRNRYNQNRKK